MRAPAGPFHWWLWRIDLDRHQVVGLDADIHVQQTIEALAKQTCAHQEHHGRRQFDHHQLRPEPGMPFPPNPGLPRPEPLCTCGDHT